MASLVTQVNTGYGTQKTWVSGDPLVAADMNTYLRDQLAGVKTPASFKCYIDEAADYTTSSTSFTDVDSTDLAATIITGGGVIMVGASLTISIGSNRVCFDVLIDGTTRLGLDDGIASNGNTSIMTAFIVPILGLSAGSHSFKLQWKTSAVVTATLYAGAGTAGGLDVHPAFWGFEI